MGCSLVHSSDCAIRAGRPSTAHSELLEGLRLATRTSDAIENRHGAARGDTSISARNRVAGIRAYVLLGLE